MLKYVLACLFIANGWLAYAQTILLDSTQLYTNPTALEDTLVRVAKSFLGVPYVYGGKDPQTGFDCSGFVQFVFAHFGLDIPRSTAELAYYGHEIAVDSSKKGDIILFSGRNIQKTPVGHAGIIISEKSQPLQFVHSATSKNRGVVVSDFNTVDYYRNRFVKIIRVINPLAN